METPADKLFKAVTVLADALSEIRDADAREGAGMGLVGILADNALYEAEKALLDFS